MKIPALVSVIFAVQDDAANINGIVSRVGNIMSSLASDYEIVIVDNGSIDQTSTILQQLTSEDGEANLQIYTLAGRVDDVTARWVGIANALGDIIISMEPQHGDIDHLELLAGEAANSNDIVFTRRTYPRGRRSLPSTMIYRVFGAATKVSTGLDLDSYSTSLIAMSRRVINYLLQCPDPQINFRNLPSTTGFRRTLITIPPRRITGRDINLKESLTRGVKIVTSSSENPLRLATSLSAFGAIASLAYSIYVILVWAFEKDLAPGWVSLSMQLSGMFFMVSLVHLVLSEYILEISRKASFGPAYYIANEMTSARLTRKERLNVEVENGLNQKSSKSLFGLKTGG